MSATETVKTTPAVEIPKVKDRTAQDSPKIIRAWAVKVGLPVGQRGRLHPDVVTAYLKSDKRHAVKALAARQDTPEVVSQMRAWALAAGLKVGARGRLPESVVSAFEAAQTESAPVEVPAAE